MSHVPYIPDPNTPHCPPCGATIYVQAEAYEIDFNLMNGKTEKRTQYRVRNQLVETSPDVITACRCPWLVAAVAGQRASQRSAEVQA
jgi:hypothetical protein